MKTVLSLMVFATALSFCLCKDVSHFKTCADKVIKDDKSLLCKVSKLEVDGNMPKVKEYINCAFDASGWTMKDGKSFDTSKLSNDMRPYGFSKQKEVEEVVKECETEFGAEISAVDYLACFLIDEKTKKEFKTTLMFKEADFFKHNLCN